MASLVLYGSSVADTTLTTANKMATATGGVETSKTTTPTSGTYVEVWSQGNAGIAGVSSIPAPDGHGWIYYPGAGTFAAGNWSAAFTLSSNGAATDITVRFYKYSAGIYTSIGSIVLSTWPSNAKSVHSFAATAMPATTLGASDGVYTDLWFHDATGASGDNPVVYESTSSTAGIANDVQVTTSNFTASGGGGATHFRIFDGYSGFFS